MSPAIQFLSSVILAIGLTAYMAFDVWDVAPMISIPACVSREHVGASQYRRGFVRIGTDLEHVELVVQPGEDMVYEIDGSEADAREIEQGGIPSVYHWVLITEEVLYGEP